MTDLVQTALAIGRERQLRLVPAKRTDSEILSRMKCHYSSPKGFVGRNRCFLIKLRGETVGAIVGGSATRFLPGRNEFFGEQFNLNSIINNVFFHCEPPTSGYQYRNFTTAVVREWAWLAALDWEVKYGDAVIGLETLVEIPRTGELYRRAGWTEVGMTKGFTCKRTAGKGTDTWSGKRVWDTINLRPKRVFCIRMEDI